MLVLRDYQEAAVRAALAHRRGLIHAPTGSGKSAILAGILAGDPGPWLVLVHREMLREQLFAAFQRFGLKRVARFGGPYYDVGDVTIATWQSVVARFERGDPRAQYLVRMARGVCVDEVHVAASPRLSELLASLQVEYRIGLSATPLDREDGKNIWTRMYFGGVIYAIDARTLVEQGALSEPVVEFVDGPTPPDWYGAKGLGYTRLIVRNQARNELLAQIAGKAERPTLLLVVQVEHGMRLLPELRAQKLRARFVWQQDAQEERLRAIDELQNGKLDVLVASPIFDVGVDIPQLRSVIVGSGGKSAIAAVQRLGRSMRPAPGKDRCYLWDIKDVGHRRLEQNVEARIKAYSMVGFAVRMPAPPPVPLRKREILPIHPAANPAQALFEFIRQFGARLVLAAFLVYIAFWIL